MKYRWSLAFLMIVAFGCGGAEEKEEPETIIGTPPAPRDDPFFFVAMPAEAVPAKTTGTIGEEGADAPPEGPGMSEAAAEAEAVEEAERTERAEPAEAAREPARTAPEPSGVQCFSCVRICPESVSDEDCGDAYDTICGWGRSADRSVAAEIANAECDAALDMARDGSRYSKITGRCPTSTCR